MTDSDNQLGDRQVDRWVELWASDGGNPSIDNFLTNSPRLDCREQLEIVLIDQQMRWQDRPGPRVEEYLRLCPELEDQPEMVLDIIVGEIRASHGLGFRVTAESMAIRFPMFLDEITKQFELSAWIDQETPGSRDFGASIAGELRTGTFFGSYELLERIGSGGMGSIFRAKHRAVQRIVALKVLHAERTASETDRQRFRNESTMIARLDHPNIMPVYEVGEVDQIPFFTTKVVSPGSLEQQLNTFSGDWPRIADITRQIATAVHHAHQHGVLHRDLKPSNVLIDERGVPFVTDFGLARVLGDARRLTASGDLIGTPVWMAPELIDPGGCDTTIASDVYGLGSILYFLLTGQPPYVGRNLVETLSAIRERDPQSPRSVNRKVPADLDLICRRAMDRAPIRRYESAGALADDLQRFLKGQSIVARALPWWEVQRRRLTHHPVRSTVAVASLLLLCAVAVYTVQLSHLNVKLTELVRQAAAARGEALRSKSNASSANVEAKRLKNDAQAMQTVAARIMDDHNQLLYAAHMRLAWQAWRDGDVRHAASLLRQCAAATIDSTDRRGMEWFHLHLLVNPVSQTFALQSGEARCISIAEDGQKLAIGTNSGVIETFDVKSQHRTATIQTDLGLLQHVLYSPDSTWLACLASAGTIKLYDLSGGIETAVIDNSHNPCIDFAFTHNGQRIIAVHQDGSLAEWGVDGKMLRSVALTSSDVKGMAISADQTRIAVAVDVSVEIRDLRTLNLILTHNVAPGGQGITDVAISANGMRCAVGRYDSSVQIIDFSGETPQEVLNRKLLDYPRAVSLSPAGDVVAVCDYGGTVHKFKVSRSDLAMGEESRSGLPVLQASGHEGRGYDIQFTADGAGVVSSGQDGIARLWPTTGNATSHFIPLPAGTTDYSKPAFLPDGSLLVSGAGGILRVNMNSHNVQHLTSEMPHEFVAVSADGTLIVGGDKITKSVVARRMSAEGVLNQVAWKREDLPCDQLSFSPDDRQLAVVNWTDNYVLILDPLSGTESLRLPARQCFAAAWSPEGSHIAFTVMDDIHVADTNEWKTRSILRGHSTTATMLAWSPDGRQIASTSRDRTVCLWNVADGTLAHRFSGHRRSVEWTEFSPDGKTLLSSDREGQLKMWHVRTGELIGTLWDQRYTPIRSFSFTDHGNRLVALSSTGAAIVFNTSR